MKSCDVCGTLNLKENNYCTHCGNRLIMEHFCPFCGEVNSDSANYCIKCQKQINPIAINDFDTLFSEYNENLLKNARITNEEYNSEILSNIFARAKYGNIYGNSAKDKVLNLASIFTECRPKSRGYERGYIFLGNIFYDDRLDDSVQIATIIHELAHYLLFSIIESLLCNILSVQTSKTLQSFVWFFLTRPEFKIMNEYCAHTVEGRFIPYGYQNYGSFNNLINELNFDENSLNDMVVFGNTFANEIIVYLEKYIDIDLREEIKLQYKKDLKSPSYESIQIETEVCFDLDIKNRLLLKVLYDILKIASQEDAQEELENIKNSIGVF